MKRNLFLLLFLFPLLFLTISCEKDEVELSPKITVKANPSEPEFDGSSIVSWEIKNLGNVLSVAVFIDNEDVSGEYFGNITLKNITEPITVRVVCATQDRDIEESLEITPKDPVVIPPDPPNISVFANPPSLPVGGGFTTISWVAENADTVMVNSLPYGPSESIDVNLVKDSTFTFIAKGPGGQKTETLSVTVEQAPPPLTPLQLLRNGKWYAHEWYLITGETRDTLFWGECTYDDYYLFKEINELEYGLVGLLCEGQTQSVYHYFQYSFDGDSIYYWPEGHSRFVSILNDTVMIHLYEGPDSSTVEVMFKHYPLPFSE